jgi:hypothetical protein
MFFRKIKGISCSLTMKQRRPADNLADNEDDGSDV